MSRERSGPIGWGLVGCGWVARDFVAPALAASASAEPLAFCDPDPRALSAMGGRLPGALACPDLEALLDVPGLQAVYVATPNVAHRPVVETAAAAGKAVLCEKPVASTIADADEIASAVRGTGVPVGTAFDQRWHPAHEAIRDLIGCGALGRVTALRITYGCWLPPGWTPDGHLHDNWRADPLRAGGGALLDLAPHGVDLVGALLGDDLVDLTVLVQSRVHDYPVDDGAVLAGRTAQDVLFSAHVAYNLPDVLPRRRLEVVGTAGQLVATDTMGQTAGGDLRFLSASRPGGADVVVDFDRTAAPFRRQIDAFSRGLLEAAGPRLGPSWPYPFERDLSLHRLLLRSAAAPSTSLPEFA